MPRFVVHDSDTGIKLLLDGPSPPTPEESAHLVDQEMKFLATNVYYGPNNKIMLDVGPLSRVRRLVDTIEESSQKYSDKHPTWEASSQAIESTSERVRNALKGEDPVYHWQPGDDVQSMWNKIYEEEFESALNKIPKPVKELTTTEKTLLNMPDNTFLLISHGSKTGGLANEGGLPFTLSNVGTALGNRTNDVYNIINTACYAGKYKPEDYQAVFPNVTNILHSDLDMPNIISLNALGHGNYFHTNTVPGIWQRTGTNWMDVLKVQTEQEPALPIDEP